jgi:hypothetical protein
MPTKGNRHISFRMTPELLSELAVSHFEWAATTKGKDKSVSHFIRTLLFRAIGELSRKRKYNRGGPQILANPVLHTGMQEQEVVEAPDGVTVPEAAHPNWMLTAQSRMELAFLSSEEDRLRYEQGK